MEYKEMSKVYAKMDEFSLRKLRSRKVLEIEKLRKFYTYFGKRDIERLAYQISAIDAELQCRMDQMRLF